MKKILLLLLSATVLISCEGDQGPPGPPGLDGGVFVAQSYEIQETFFAPEYRFRVNHPIEVLDTDMVLVYLSWDQVNASDGLPTDVWRLLPQTIYSDFGEFSYNYESTFDYVEIFMDGPLSTDFNLLSSADTDNQIFRVVILPVDFANDPNLDVTDYNSVMQVTGLSDSDFIKIE